MASLLTDQMTGDSVSEIVGLASQRRRPLIGHGAPREDFDSQHTLRGPLLASASHATARSPASSATASQTNINSSVRSPQSAFWGLQHRHYANIRGLRGKISRVPRFWLWPRFLNNSFFARRLMLSGLLRSRGASPCTTSRSDSGSSNSRRGNPTRTTTAGWWSSSRASSITCCRSPCCCCCPGPDCGRSSRSSAMNWS